VYRILEKNSLRKFYFLHFIVLAQLSYGLTFGRKQTNIFSLIHFQNVTIWNVSLLFVAHFPTKSLLQIHERKRAHPFTVNILRVLDCVNFIKLTSHFNHRNVFFKSFWEVGKNTSIFSNSMRFESNTKH